MYFKDSADILDFILKGGNMEYFSTPCHNASGNYSKK